MANFDFDLKKHEKMIILECLTYYDGNVKDSAKNLGITRATLYRKMDEYQIKIHKFRPKDQSCLKN